MVYFRLFVHRNNLWLSHAMETNSLLKGSPCEQIIYQRDSTDILG
jgi:hypothetical protein